LGTLLRSDICDRAIPWTRLALAEGHLPDDLNLRAGARVSAGLACLLLAALLLAPWWPASLAVAGGALAGIAVLNRDLYSFFARQRGRRFLLAAVPLHLLYFLYSVAGFAAGVALHLAGRLGAGRRDAVAQASSAR
jgi:hypothetical protein